MNIIKKLFRRRTRVTEFKEYGYDVMHFDIPPYGNVDYAGWLHPSESKKDISPEILKVYRELIQPGDSVIDIGAHTGDTTVPMALCAGIEGTTFALEPNPYVFKILEKNAQLNPSKTHIIPLNFAATETDGDFTFHYSDAAYCNGGYLSQIQNQYHGHNYPLTVKGCNLENYLQLHHPAQVQQIRFIKTDTEGYDLAVLKSLKNLIQNNRPIIVAEMLKKLNRDERLALFHFLSDLNYQCRYFDWQDTHGITLSAENLMNWKHYDILAIPE